MTKYINWIDILKKNGCRVTPARKSVINIVSNSSKTLKANEVFDLARETYPKLGLVSVYRTLDKLEELRLVQRVHHPDGCHAYTSGFSGHQHLLLCDSCGDTHVFEGDDMVELLDRVQTESGFIVRDHWLQFHGICQSCQDGTE